MRALRVGDPHVRPSNLAESEALLDLVERVAREERADRIEVLGDLYHTHAVVRLEAVEFWRRRAMRLAEVAPTVLLTGNHDMPGDHQSEWQVSALDCLPSLSRLVVVKSSLADPDSGLAYLSYTHDNAKFLSEARRMRAEHPGIRTLVCHATFQGSRYENGMYAPGGIDPEEVPFDFVVSGHIHAQQSFDKVHYVGTPRWDSSADANQEKGLWLYEHAPDGAVLSKRMVPTSGACSPLVEAEWREGDPMPEWPEGARATCTLVGSSAWVRTAKAAAQGAGARTRAVYTDRERARTREASAARGVEEYLERHFEPAAGVSKSALLEYLGSL